MLSLSRNHAGGTVRVQSERVAQDRNAGRTAAARRQGTVLALAAFLMIVVLAFAAFTVDVGYIAYAKAQLQTSADAAALAGAMELLQQSRLRGGAYLAETDAAARRESVRYAAENVVASLRPAIDPNADIQVGRLGSDGSVVTISDERRYNAVQVRCGLDGTRNRALPLFFAPVIGHASATLTADATAAFPGGVGGFRITNRTGNSSLIPFTVHVDEWAALVGGRRDDGDGFRYDPNSETVASGQDDVRELRLWNGDNLNPGNFGLLRIGDPGLGNEGIQRQIREGVSSADAAWYGGEIRLDPRTGTIDFGGDTGLTTNHARVAAEIVGKPVTLPLYRTVQGSGSGAVFTIVGFVGVRIMDVVENGSNRHIRIQPAYVVDETAIPGTGTSSWFVFGKAALVR